jgi:Raf kinase inhibitor-like YbhB/YbcL family protein
MELTSPDFEDGGMIPSSFSCDGENINPTLEISGIPEDAESLVLIMDDPDAPNGLWTHWTLWNIEPKADTIPAGTAPIGSVEGTTSSGKTGYAGPCPPSGTHRYFFRLFALNTTLDLPAGTDANQLKEAIEGNKIAECELVGMYARNVD